MTDAVGSDDLHHAALETEIGWIEVGATDTAIVQLRWHHRRPKRDDKSPLLDEARRQLGAYIEGRLQLFDLPLAPAGSDFAKAVWREMLAIPYGRSRTYGDVAIKLKAPAQLVGQACGQNPIAVIIPCHRILGANSLGGYSSALGIRAKTFLLDLERGQGRLF